MEGQPKPVGRAQKLMSIMKSRTLTTAETPVKESSSQISEEQKPEQFSAPEATTSEMSSSRKVCGRGLKLLQGVSPEKLDKFSIDKSVPESTKPIKGRGRFLEQMRTQMKPKEEILLGDTDKPRKSLMKSSEEAMTQGMKKLEIESDKGPCIKRGELGEKLQIYTNFVTLTVDPEKGIYEYEVRFEPKVESKGFRYKLINNHFEHKKGIRCYDGGDKLYMPEKCIADRLVVEAKHPGDNSDIAITLTYKKQLMPRESSQLYNILFHNCAKVLNMARLGRQHYDYQSNHRIPQHKLEIWPGYVTSVEEFEGGIHLCCDIRHRVLRMDTAHDVLANISKFGCQDFRTRAIKELLGECVLTRYNNNLYRIDDIDWNKTPLSTFKLKSGEEISFLNYYKKQYGLDIIDLRQPLLVNKPKPNKKGERSPLVCLVPELCYMTGLTDKMRKDMRVMKEIASYTRVTPAQRHFGLKKFMENIRNNSKAQEMLNDWGLKIAEDPVLMGGRILPSEELVLKNDLRVLCPKNVEWSKYIRNHGVFRSIDITDWLLVHVNRDSKLANLFNAMIQKVGPGLGLKIENPVMVPLQDDKIDTFVSGLKSNITKKTQIVVCLCPTSRDDRYSAIKKLCCRERPILSQIVNCSSIARENKMRSVVQNVALQMNNKLGGATWALQIPLKNCMICGIDSYHDTGKMGRSVGAFVASIDKQFTSWFSQTCFQEPRQELVDGLIQCFMSGLKKYHSVNNCLPERIVIFRDGVSDGQLIIVQKYEVQQFLLACKMISPNYCPKFSFIVVQKRINTKFYQLLSSTSEGEVDNPPSGCVVDSKITRRNFYDFFLVSQHVTSGTATPSHYVVLYDNCEMKPDIVQRLTYKLCHIYYNWPGTIRVPAPCQYAHKLAYLVGQNVRGMPDIVLDDKLYYL